MAYFKNIVSPVHMHWIYHSLPSTKPSIFNFHISLLWILLRLPLAIGIPVSRKWKVMCGAIDPCLYHHWNFRPCCATSFRKKHIYIYKHTYKRIYIHIHIVYNFSGSWNTPPWYNKNPFPIYKINDMNADDLVMQGARASTAMILASLLQCCYNKVKILTLWHHNEYIIIQLNLWCANWYIKSKRIHPWL